MPGWFVWGCIILYCISMLLIDFLSSISWQEILSWIIIMGVGVVLAVVYVVVRIFYEEKIKNRNVPEINRESEENSTIDDDLVGKAHDDFRYIQSKLKKIDDAELEASLRKLQGTAARMMLYLGKNPDRLPVARQFINYYQDRTAQFVRQYIILKCTKLNSEEFFRLRQEMLETFSGFSVAYEKEFAKVVDDRLLDVSAELKVAKQVLDSEGITYDINTEKDSISENIAAARKQAPPEQEPQKSDGVWKYVGAAAAGVALGLFGAYKYFGKDEQEGRG